MKQPEDSTSVGGFQSSLPQEDEKINTTHSENQLKSEPTIISLGSSTRSVVKRNHAIIAPDGYVESTVPGWTGCKVNVIINEQMGARLCQTLVTFTAPETSQMIGSTEASQIFFYIVHGEVEVTIGHDTDSRILTKGKFVYVPVGHSYSFKKSTPNTQLLTFHKRYEPLAGHAVPDVHWGGKNEDDSMTPLYLNDDGLRLQELLPNELGFDMAVNIFTYQPGASLPLVETHIMEHGLLYLQGQAIYKLDQQWYPVMRGDSIWMAPYCQQWCASIGKEPSVYIYYKNVNRFPTLI